MRKTLTFLAVLLIPALAFAGWNIKQNPDGSTTWQNQDSEEVPVGDAGLPVYIADLSTASTAFIASHKAGHIAAVYVTRNDALSAQSDAYNVTIAIAATAIPADGWKLLGSGGASSVTTITTAGTSTAGYVDSLTFTRSATNNSVGVGDVIAIQSDGGSTGAADGTITIVIQ